MIPQTLNLEDIVEGHTWAGIPNIVRTDTPEGGTPAPPASNLATVEMVWSLMGDDAANKTTYNSTDHPERIAIVSAANWQMTVPKQILPFAAGRWEWLITTIAADGTRDPLLTGKITIREAP